MRGSQAVEEGGLASIGIAYQGHNGCARVFATFAVQLAGGAYMLQFFFKLIFLTAQHAAVKLDLLFTFTTLLHATLPTRDGLPPACQAPQVVIPLCPIDPGTSFPD